MVRVRYIGISQERAVQVFNDLKDYRNELIRLSGYCRPFSEEWKLFYEAQRALDRAAGHFTGDAGFYSLKPPRNWSTGGD